MREASVFERQILAKLLSCPFPGRDDVASLLESALVSEIDPEGSLAILCRSKKMAPTVRQVPVEGEMPDEDGVAVHVLLHVREGQPKELEIYKDDGTPIIRAIDPEKLDVVVLPPHPASRSDD